MSYLAQTNLTTAREHLNRLGFVNDKNSFDTTLASTTSLTGKFVRVGRFSSVTYLVNSDQDGTLDIEYSMDSITADKTISVNN